MAERSRTSSGRPGEPPGHTQHTGWVLITAAASGIGLACAQLLDQLGFGVFAGMRDMAKATVLQQQSSAKLTPILLDVTSPYLIARAVQYMAGVLAQEGTGLIGVVNTATNEHHGPLELLPLDFIRQEIEVDYLGSLAVIKACLPLLRQSRGRIVNFSSVTGRCVFRGIGASCAAKYAVEAMSDALRLELAPWGMHVTVIEPGATDTPLWDKVQHTFEELPQHVSLEQLQLYYPSWPEAVQQALADKEAFAQVMLPAARMAQAVLHALTSQRPKTRYLVVRWDDRALIMLKRLLPDKWFDRLAMLKFRDQPSAVTGP